MKSRTPWTTAMMLTCINHYNSMLLCEAAAKPYTKASHRRACAAATGKSEGSIEFFFCNISAAREKQGLPIIRGYKARDNYNKALDALVNPTAQQEQTA